MSDSRSMAIQQQKRQEIHNLDELKKDIRKSHFTMGGDLINYVSHAGNTMIEHPITAEGTVKNTQNRKI